MAMRGRRPSSFRTQPALRPVYLDFKPKSDMTENPEAHVLLIQLPGFTKERIRVQFDDSSKMMKVYGERPIEGGNRRSRFREAYSVPQNCITHKIQSNFFQGILTIIMPKMTISQAEVKPTQEQEAPEGPQKAEQVIIPPSKSATQQQQKPRDNEKTASSSSISGADLKAQKSQEETPQRPVVDSQKTGKELTMAIAAAAPEKKPDGMTQKVREETETKPTIKLDEGKVEDEKFQKVQQEIEPKPKLVMSPRNNTADEKPQKKGQEDTEPKATSEMVPGKPLNEKLETSQEGTNQSATLTSVSGNQSGKKTGEKKGEDTEKEGISNKEIIEEGKPSQSIKAGNGAKEKSMVTEKEIRERRELPKTDGPVPKIPQEERNLNDHMIDAIGKGIKDVTSSASQAFTRIAGGKWDDEDKSLLLNMGASILVLAAVGIYALYRFSS